MTKLLNRRGRSHKVIVSLTSWPPAVGFVPGAVRSLLAGTVVPDKIVLYLAEMQFPGRSVPDELAALVGERFEIRWCENDDIRSYKKLIPALRDFPDDVIVTVDDDEDYRPRMLEMLLKQHRKHPDAIVAHNVRRFRTHRDGTLKGYFEWSRYKPVRYLWHPPVEGFRNLQFGLGGVLYPPRSLAVEMLRPELFMEMAPTVDDVWFWAAAVAAGTRIQPVPWGYFASRPLGKPAEISLGKGNTRSGVDVNRGVVEQILKRWPVIRERLESETGPIKL